MRLGRVGKQILPIQTRIEESLAGGILSPRQAESLQAELLGLLLSPETPGRRLYDFCARHRGLRRRLSEAAVLSAVQSRLPHALYACYVKRCPERICFERYPGVQPSDWRFVHAYAEELGKDLPTEVVNVARPRGTSPDWVVRAEADFEEVEVHVEPAALEAMILSVYETYKVPQSSRGPGFTETYGVCFGTRSVQTIARRGRGSTDLVKIHLQRSVPQLRARATSGSVSPDMRSTGLFLEVGSRLFRHCEIVGEFHSHPYRDLTELKNAGGWNHSREDQAYVHQQVDAWRRLRQNPRVFLICAVARGKSSSLDRLAAKSANVFTFHLSACRFYLAAYRILPNGDLADDGIALHCCGSAFGNGR